MDILDATDLNATELNAMRFGPDRLEALGAVFASVLMFGYAAYAVGRAHALAGMSDAHTIRRHIDTIVLIGLATLSGACLFVFYLFFRNPIPIHDETYLVSFLIVQLAVYVDYYALMHSFQVRRDINNGRSPGSGWGLTHLGSVRGSGGGERKDDAYQPLISPESEPSFARGEA